MQSPSGRREPGIVTIGYKSGGGRGVRKMGGMQAGLFRAQPGGSGKGVKLSGDHLTNVISTSERTSLGLPY